MKNICIAQGDGIGPEIMESVIKILNAAEVKLRYEALDIGEKVYLSGISSGITEDGWNSILQNKILLKGPMTTPLGGGYKSINVTLRKKLGLFANVRPVMSYEPYIACNAKNMDMVIVRENEEDLYSGIEYQTTANSYVAVKLITEAGSRRIIRYAFNYAVLNHRKTITCITKNNIMKLSDGCFARVFDEIAQEYPTINHKHMIVDIGAARIASKPSQFDVVVTLNLYGDIISDIAAEAAGAVGIAGSANIGGYYAMFEAVHGSAPDIARQGKANPSGLLHAAVMMLKHIDMQDKAQQIEEAWLQTIKSGIQTVDLESRPGKSVTTSQFTDAIINNLDTAPKVLMSKGLSQIQSTIAKVHKAHKVIGCDIYVRSANCNTFNNLSFKAMKLKFIGHKGLVIWPGESCNDELDMLQFRFIKDNCSQQDILEIQMEIIAAQLEIVMFNILSQYDGKDGFSRGQGE
jgi:isocitrate dehydrogenase